MSAKSQPFDRARELVGQYAGGLTADDVHRLFTKDTAEAYRFFVRNIDHEALAKLPPAKRYLTYARLFFFAFTMRLSPPRRVLYAVALLSGLIGLLKLFSGFGVRSVSPGLPPVNVGVPVPVWPDGTLYLFVSLVLLNLLFVLEVADRLSLKGDLEVARDIQLAMLPRGTWTSPRAAACGLTRPANTVGGDFYDILALPDGRLAVAVGDVAGKGSPAALLMALLLAILRTLVDEGLEPAELVERLNVQVARHAPASRFITLFYGVFDPTSGTFTYVNAGHMPPLVRRAETGTFERLPSTGVALGMFEESKFAAERAHIAPGDLVVLYSDGITEAEDPSGQPFEETGLERVLGNLGDDDLAAAGLRIFTAVERHAQDKRFSDDLTVLLLKRPAAVPALHTTAVGV